MPSVITTVLMMTEGGQSMVTEFTSIFDDVK